MSLTYPTPTSPFYIPNLVHSEFRIPYLKVPDLKQLAQLFYPSLEDLGRFTPVEATELPSAYQGLLAHDDHMTVTLEAFHDSLMNVQVLQQRYDPPYYSRKSLLARRTDGKAVQFGIMRITLDGLPKTAQDDLSNCNMPLGRILIRHHVLRHVELCQLWQVVPSKELQTHLGLTEDSLTFGRIAQIIMAGEVAVELLEIAIP
jgi:chorismate-pyruvate lyase